MSSGTHSVPCTCICAILLPMLSCWLSCTEKTVVVAAWCHISSKKASLDTVCILNEYGVLLVSVFTPTITFFLNLRAQ